MSDKAEILEGIQEKEGQDNPDPTILEEEEKMEEGSKLPWRQAGDEEGTLAMAPSEIARYIWQLIHIMHRESHFHFLLGNENLWKYLCSNDIRKGPHKLYAILCVMHIAMHQVALFMSNPEPVPHFCQLLATTFVLRLVVHSGQLFNTKN